MNKLEQVKQISAEAVLSWIIESHGIQVGQTWLWSCTPYPAGLPSEEMLTDGVSLALKEISINDLLQKADNEITQAMAELNKESL